jgi:hypothetical protein
LDEFTDRGEVQLGDLSAHHPACHVRHTRDQAHQGGDVERGVHGGIANRGNVKTIHLLLGDNIQTPECEENVDIHA